MKIKTKIIFKKKKNYKVYIILKVKVYFLSVHTLLRSNQQYTYFVFIAIKKQIFKTKISGLV